MEWEVTCCCTLLKSAHYTFTCIVFDRYFHYKRDISPIFIVFSQNTYSIKFFFHYDIESELYILKDELAKQLKLIAYRVGVHKINSTGVFIVQYRQVTKWSLFKVMARHDTQQITCLICHPSLFRKFFIKMRKTSEIQTSVHLIPSDQQNSSEVCEHK